MVSLAFGLNISLLTDRSGRDSGSIQCHYVSPTETLSAGADWLKQR